MAKNEPLSLSGLVEHVASELRTIKAKKPSAGQEVITLSGCEIELSAAATLEGSAGIKFYIVELGGKGSKTASHKIKLTFTAASGIVAAQTRTVSGERPVVTPNPSKE